MGHCPNSGWPGETTGFALGIFNRRRYETNLEGAESQHLSRALGGGPMLGAVGGGGECLMEATTLKPYNNSMLPNLRVKKLKPRPFQGGG